MTTPVNLNRFRKEKAKADAKVSAVENRVKFGRTKAETSLARAQREKAERTLDSSKRED